jgi:hypothetical protein
VFASLPPEVQSVVREFRTCEFTTLSKSGTPVTWPVSARYLPEQEHFLLTTSIGLPQKAYNIRRSPRVSLLFSNPTACGLEHPAAVLVQGDATVGDKVVVSPGAEPGLREYWRETIFRRQPSSAMISSNALMRKLMDWYYMRLVIHVAPRAWYWWPEGDFSQPACKIELPEAPHVA